jgi:hypothetical protein
MITSYHDSVSIRGDSWTRVGRARTNVKEYQTKLLAHGHNMASLNFLYFYIVIQRANSIYTPVKEIP